MMESRKIRIIVLTIGMMLLLPPLVHLVQPPKTVVIEKLVRTANDLPPMIG